ncbi:hypothetical protein FQN05_11765 [Corynebacterium aurimucosum]|uniref:Uncharacterized protein n=1 Tax=Corynebacterium aurimucosum TaxID=169292 RepID=A0A558IIX5_9CORY|nr:hypothetical protein FQN05_11765 [Corynebacterium aurimucosum]
MSVVALAHCASYNRTNRTINTNVLIGVEAFREAKVNLPSNTRLLENSMSEFLPLAGLALVDSLSAGTLVIPIALIVIWRRVRLGLLGTYLATIATAYCWGCPQIVDT